MADLGRDIAKLVRVAYPAANTSLREVIMISVFWRHFQGLPQR